MNRGNQKMFELTVNKLVPTLATSIVAREGETTAIVTLSHTLCFFL